MLSNDGWLNFSNWSMYLKSGPVRRLIICQLISNLLLRLMHTILVTAHWIISFQKNWQTLPNLFPFLQSNIGIASPSLSSLLNPLPVSKKGWRNIFSLLTSLHLNRRSLSAHGYWFYWFYALNIVSFLFLFLMFLQVVTIFSFMTFIFNRTPLEISRWLYGLSVDFQKPFQIVLLCINRKINSFIHSFA